MLEVLYATGLRVSEPVSFKHDQVNLNQGVMRVVGRATASGRSLGDEAVRWLSNLSRARAWKSCWTANRPFVPHSRGDRMTRQAFWHIIKLLEEGRV